MKNISLNNHRYLPLAEGITLFVLLILSLLCVGPLVEEWGLLHAFNVRGMEFFVSFAKSNPFRPLHLTSAALEWLLGFGHPIGVSIVAGLFFLARYFAIRWAVSPWITGYSRWSIATLAAVLVSWPGVWLVRYQAAQLSAILFFIVLGLCIRLAQKPSRIQMVICSALVVLMSMNYEGLTLCLLAIPVASLVWSGKKDKNIKAIFWTILVGFLIYGIYAFLNTSIMHSAGYEAGITASSKTLLKPAGLMLHIITAYSTAYSQNTLVFPVFLSIACLFLVQSQGLLLPAKTRTTFVLLLASLFLLPLLSLIYMNALHIHDPERVLFPVSVGFVLVCVTLMLAMRRISGMENSNPLIAVLIVILLLSFSIVSALKIKQYKDIEQNVIRQTLSFVEKEHPKSIILSDSTGTLGDVYTFLETIFGSALTFYGHPMDASICTPIGVDRLHPVAQRFPIPSTKRCETLPTSEGQLWLYASQVNNKIILSRQPLSQ